MSAGFSRRDVVFAVLGSFFLTNALVAELAGGKVIHVGPESWTLFGNRLAATVGVVLWPVVFVTTDLINEYYGRAGVRRLSFMTAGMIAWVFVMLQLLRLPPSAGFPNTVTDEAFDAVFGQSQWIIVGSLIAFLVGQFVDVAVFHRLRRLSGPRALWLRSTGSTVVSQLIDTVVVLWIGLGWPKGWDLDTFARVAVPNYLIKLVIAVAMTPAIYLVHGFVERYLGHSFAEELAEAAARDSE